MASPSPSRRVGHRASVMTLPGAHAASRAAEALTAQAQALKEASREKARLAAVTSEAGLNADDEEPTPQLHAEHREETNAAA